MSNFLLGEKVTWSTGRLHNPIILKGLYLEKVDEEKSLVLCYEQNSRHVRLELSVNTNLLKKDE